MTLDLRSRYYHITLTLEARAKTAFVTPFGKYEFNKVLFGLAEAAAYFQELICKVIGNVPYVMGYLDDIIIFSKIEEEHLQHIADIFKKLCKAGLKLKLSKFSFFQKELQYLGHLISEEGVQPLPEKIRKYPKHACTEKCKRNETVPRTSQLLLKIHTQIFGYRMLPQQING